MNEKSLKGGPPGRKWRAASCREPGSGASGGRVGETAGTWPAASPAWDQAPMPSTAGLNMNMRSRMLCGASVMPQPMVRASFSGR